MILLSKQDKFSWVTMVLVTQWPFRVYLLQNTLVIKSKVLSAIKLPKTILIHNQISISINKIKTLSNWKICLDKKGKLYLWWNLMLSRLKTYKTSKLIKILVIFAFTFQNRESFRLVKEFHPHYKQIKSQSVVFQVFYE